MANQARVLFVDDDATATASLIRSLKRHGGSFETIEVTSSGAAIDTVRAGGLNAAVVDLCLDETLGPTSGLELISSIIETEPSIRVLVLTGHGSEEYGIQALHRGAASFIEKPVSPEHLLGLINDAVSFSWLKKSYQELITSPAVFAHLPGLSSANKKMQKVISDASYAASNGLPVLILGETGTGKGVIAKAIFSAQSHHTKKTGVILSKLCHARPRR